MLAFFHAQAGSPEARFEARFGSREPRLAGSKKRPSKAEGESRAPLEQDGELDESQRSGLPDVFRKMMAMGFSGLFTTEAALRGALGDSVPREWVDFLSEQSERTRAEFAEGLAQEFGRVLREVDLLDFTQQLLEGRTIEVKAEFRLGPRDGDEEMSQTETQPTGRGKS